MKHGGCCRHITLEDIWHKLNQMEAKMADDMAGLDADIQAQNAVLQEVIGKVQKVVDDTAKILQDVDALLAKVGTGVPVDTATQRQAIQSQIASLQTTSGQLDTVVQGLEAGDTKANA